MRAALLEKTQAPLSIVNDVEVEEPRPGEVLVKVSHCGICHSDLTVVDTPGVYTFSHAAGYGLLYQLTGDKKYAQFGKQCFEKALAGVRDRDDRYSFRKPGGALRAGPTLGWYAVGYDLCCDGWEPLLTRSASR